MASGMAPLVRQYLIPVPAVATAGNDDENPVLVAPFAGTVTKVSYIPKTGITGANTNTRAVRLRNKGQSGTGTTVVAELQFDAGVNAAAFDEKAVPLSSTQGNLVVAAGDVLAWFSDAVGTGMADPGGLALIEITRD